jgi:mono/diheme cytochrome c family protein
MSSGVRWAAVAFLACISPRGLAETGDPAAGRSYALRQCAQCHAVEAGKISTVAAAPSFADVANWPGMSVQALSVWLTTPHPTMPMTRLRADTIEDLAAYLATLKSTESAG